MQHYKQDMAALAVLTWWWPCYRLVCLAGMELGYAVGAGKHTVVYAPAIREADLMLKMVDASTTNFEEVLQF